MYGDTKRDGGYIARLAEFIRREYGMNAESVAPAKRGFFGETWRLDAEGRVYFVKVDYAAAHKAVYERSFHAVQHLCDHGIDFISRIIKTKDGALSTRFDGGVLAVFEWIDGKNEQNEHTKTPEYQMLAKIYTVPTDGLTLPREDFSGVSARTFFAQAERLKTAGQSAAPVLAVLDHHREKIARRAERLTLFAERCQSDTSGFAVTHGDAGGNVMVCGDRFFIVDWDDPILAPPERDAWFCLYWPWAMDAFNAALRDNGVNYRLRDNRLAYYCYHSFFFYLTEYMNAFFDIGDPKGDFTDQLDGYFSCWIEKELEYADGMP